MSESLPDPEKERLDEVRALMPRRYDGMHLVDCPYVDVLLRIRAVVNEGSLAEWFGEGEVPSACEVCGSGAPVVGVVGTAEHVGGCQRCVDRWKAHLSVDGGKASDDADPGGVLP